MSAFPESGRSGTAKTGEMKGRFRPQADVQVQRIPVSNELLLVNVVGSCAQINNMIWVFVSGFDDELSNTLHEKRSRC